MFGLSVKPFFGFLVASLISFISGAPAAFANPYAGFGSTFEMESPTCNRTPVSDYFESEVEAKENDSGSTAESNKNKESQEINRETKKSGSGSIWILKGKGESSSTSSNKAGSLSENKFESDWNRNRDSSELKKEKVHRDDNFITNCDSFNKAAAESNQALYKGIAQTYIASVNADRDENIASINADMKKNINYEQQVTHRLAIKTSADVKMSEINMQSNFALAQFYSHLGLQPQGGQQ
ncbi:MAG: hypothetical protein AAF378_14700 [Cyanobacteria bacterium P01_A01_bin.84]